MRNIYNLFQYSVFAFLLLWGSLAHGQVALPAEITEANCKAKLLPDKTYALFNQDATFRFFFPRDGSNAQLPFAVTSNLFFIKVATGGSIQMMLDEAEAPFANNLDYALWGPYDNLTDPGTKVLDTCVDFVTTATYPYGTRPTGVRSSVQRFNLTPRTGQYYLLFVDNVDKLARTFKMSFTSSNGGVIDAIPNGNTPTISGQPASNAACPGGTLSLNVTATNATGYQWRFNNVNIANATGSTYTKTNFSSANSGRYDVIVSSGSGCYALSNAAVITAGSGTAPTISGQPASANSCVGQSATFAVTASGSSLSYQWRKNGANIPNANSASYTVGSVGNADAGQYDVVVSGSCGSVISSQVGLTVRTPVSITTQPTAQVACPGGSVTFQTAASGDITGYQWRKNSTNIPNATSASLTLSNVGSGNAGQYDVVVSGSCGNVTSSQAGMTVNTPVSIATQPTNQAICSGGSVTFQVTASGDITGYQWRKNGVNIPNANSASLITNGLTNNDSGAYDVVVQGRCGNVTSSQATLTVPSEMQLNISSSAVSCFQGNNGQATVTVSGGASGYSYAWNNGTGTATASDLSAGTYQVTVTDRIGCRKNTSVTVSQPTRLALSMTSAAVKCFGGSDGIATVLASGGAGNYSYRWNSGATTASSGGLNAGTYMVTVTDGNGCVKTASVEVTQPTLMVLNISATAAKCFAGNDGTATVATTGGVGAYSYRWSNGANTATANGLAAGTYTVTVTDGNGCVKTASVEVTQPTLVVLSISSTAAKCFAGNDGTATVTVSGGTGNYSYRWSNRDGGPATTTATANGLTAGTYSVDVTDGNGCVKTASVQVAQPTEVVLTTGSTPVKCFGSNDGTAAVTAAGGTGAYSYRWNTGATTASVSGLIAGTYQVTVTDGNGCAKTVSIEVIQPLVVALSMTSAAVKCFGGSDGIATVLASGGAGNYSYRWSSAATTASSGGLNAGTYMVTVTDGNGCVKTASVEVTQPTLMVLNISATAAKCFAGNDGTATVAATGGVGAYSYRWSNGANTATANGLAAGTYTVTVTDGNGCVKTASVEVTQPTAIELITSSTPANCFGSTDGAAVVAVSGGTGVYSYRWNTRDGGPGATTAAISQLAAGQYQVTVSDASGCQQVGTTTVSQPTVVVLSTSSTAVKCFGGNDGIALVTASGGVGNYTYHWNIGTTTPTTSQLITGAYTVTVTDGNGCVKTTTVQVTQPTRVQFTFQKENVYCFGGSDGKVTLNATGGVGNFQFTVNGTNPTGFASGAQHLLTGLASATYQLALTDGNACPTPAQSVSITQPSQPVSVSLLSFLNPRGFGLTDGSVQVAASGGTLQYTTNWQNTGGTAIGTGQSVSDGKGGIVNTLSQLGDNTYTLTVRDANFNLATQKQGCTATVTQRLVEPAKLTLLLATTQPVACFGRRDARILATADGGVPTDSPLKYTFRWLQQTGGTYTRLNFEGLDIQNLPAGSYRCIVTDKNNITQQADMVITEPTKLLAAASDIKNNLCVNDQKGTAVITMQGGTQPYAVDWSNGAVGPALANLKTGRYLALISDKNGCTAEVTLRIQEPVALALSVLTRKNPTCNDRCDGQIQTVVRGGVQPYSLSWGTGQPTTPTLNNLCGGNYTPSVRDANGCVATLPAIELVTPAAKTLTVSPDRTLCEGQSLQFDATQPGTNTYTWLLPNNSTSSQARQTLSQAGPYSVTVTDGAGCLASSSFVIRVVPMAGQLSFIMASQGFVGDTIVVVNLSTGSNQFGWVLPGSVRVLSQTTAQVRFVSTQSGTLSVGLRGSNGSCEAELYKTITIRPASGRRAVQVEPTPTALLVFPNPTAGTFRVQLSFGKVTDARLLIVNAQTGQPVHTQSLAGESAYDLPISLPDVVAGLYIVQVATATEQLTHRLLIVR